MAALTNLVFLSLLTLVALSNPGVAATAAITVLKCCRDGEELRKSLDVEELRKLLDANQNATSGELCVPSASPWQPLIYSPTEKRMLSAIPRNWDVQESKRPVCKGSVTPTYIPYRRSNPFFLFDNGQVVLNAVDATHIRPGRFCADSNALLACLPKLENAAAATMKPRVHRCCGEGAVYHEKGACVLKNETESGSSDLFKNASFVEMVQGFPICNKSDQFIMVGLAEDAVLQPDGGLEIKGIWLPTGQFCVERIKDLDVAKVLVCSEHAPQRPVQQKTSDARHALYASGFIISAVFLAATLAAGWLLPAAHHVLHWRCQTHHVACLMLGDILLAIIQIAGVSIDGVACKSIAIMAHFFFLATFFWLNTMCFNIWWTFSDVRPTNLEKDQEKLRLRIYACYAWGGPFLVAGIAALLDHLPPNDQETFIRPGFGEQKCWFKHDAVLAYFYGPVGTLLAMNLLFFAATARELTCGLWKRDFVKSTTERAALGRVCMKLVVVMGITWVADVFSWAVGGPMYLWYFTDLINAFQGVFIFAVVACQPQVWAALKRLCNRNPRTNAGRQGNALSTTSHGIPSMGDSVTQNPSTKTAPLETIC